MAQTSCDGNEQIEVGSKTTKQVALVSPAKTTQARIESCESSSFKRIDLLFMCHLFFCAIKSSFVSYDACFEKGAL